MTVNVASMAQLISYVSLVAVAMSNVPAAAVAGGLPATIPAAQAVFAAVQAQPAAQPAAPPAAPLETPPATPTTLAPAPVASVIVAKD